MQIKFINNCYSGHRDKVLYQFFDQVARDTVNTESIPDFGDAVVAAVCRSNANSVIVTFDKKLAKKLNALGLEAK